MKKLVSLTLSLFLCSGAALAGAPQQAAKPVKPKTRVAKKPDAVAAKLEELSQALQAQQAQLQLLKEELGKRDRQIEEAREAAAAANARAAEASAKTAEVASTTAEVKATTAALDGKVADLKTSEDALHTTVTAEEGKVKTALESPSTIHYKGISITPGGFIAAETIHRSHAVSGDDNTPFTGIPYPANALSKVTENNFTARPSRLSLLAETKIGVGKISAYYEADFLGAGVTSNNRQSNSYVMRQRQVFGQVAFNSGWIVTGGQMWSLATEYKNGLLNRQEAIPLTVDHQYNVGFTWARQYGFRVVKDFGGKFALGVAVEAPQTTFGGRGFNTVTNTSATGAVTTSQNFFVNAPGAGGGLFNAFDPTGYSVNKAPDIIMKATADPGFGHYEVFGIVSTLRNRIYPCAVVGTDAKNLPTPVTPTIVSCPLGNSTSPSALGAFNDSRTGGGGGASLRVPVIPKKLDFGIKVVVGDGIGRYGSAQLPDVTFRPDGTQALIRTAHGLAALEAHPTPAIDLYAYFGTEYAARAAYAGYTIITVTNTPAIPATGTGGPNPTPAIPATSNTSIKLNQIGGYGSPFAVNTGCSTETAPGGSSAPGGGSKCAGDIRDIYEGTLGFWHRFYQGPKGRLQWGVQYSYVSKTGWSGGGIKPKAVDNMIFTSFRFYLP